MKHTNLISNPLGEEIPHFMLANHNHTAKGAWQGNHCPAPLGSAKGNTTAVGRATTEDIATGWAGHLTTREMKDRWCRHCGIPLGNQLDNHREKIFNLQWSRTWQLRALKGWTPLASIDLDLHGEETRAEHEEWALGCPQWYSEHQP